MPVLLILFGLVLFYLCRNRPPPPTYTKNGKAYYVGGDGTPITCPDVRSVAFSRSMSKSIDPIPENPYRKRKVHRIRTPQERYRNILEHRGRCDEQDRRDYISKEKHHREVVENFQEPGANPWHYDIYLDNKARADRKYRRAMMEQRQRDKEIDAEYHKLFYG